MDYGTELADFFIRMARASDVPECRAVDLAAWGEEAAATEEMFSARISRYPQGNFVAIERATGAIVATVWTLSLDSSVPITTWMESSGNGKYDSLDVHGDTIFGVNVSVLPTHAGRKVAAPLVDRVASMGWVFGKRRSVLGSRMPEFHVWKGVFRAEDYIYLKKAGGNVFFCDPQTDAVHDGGSADALLAAGVAVRPTDWPVASALPPDARTFDGEMAYFMGITVRGTPCRVLGLLPGYFADPDSCDYGALVGWTNPGYIPR